VRLARGNPLLAVVTLPLVHRSHSIRVVRCRPDRYDPLIVARGPVARRAWLDP
jgi:hypothetical protein